MILARTILALAGLLAVSASATADSIELRRSVRRGDVETPVRLRDVARLDGDYALELGGIVLLDATEAPRNHVHVIDVREVRTRLTDAGVEWARVDLSGGEIRLRPAPRSADGREGEGTRIAGGARASQAEDVPVFASPPAGFKFASTHLDRPEGDLSRVITELLLGQLGDPVDLADRILLSIDLSPFERLPGGLVDLRVDFGTQLADVTYMRISGRDQRDRRRTTHVPVHVKVARFVPVAADRIVRSGDRPLAPGDVILVERAVPLTAVVPDLEAIIGSQPRRTIERGARIDPSMLKLETIVNRGAEVEIRIVDGVHVSSSRGYRALADGVVGDRITCQTPDGSKIDAVVVGPDLLEIRFD